MAGLAWGAVLALTGRMILAREIAGLFAGDRFVTGAHRLNWYLHHGWTGSWPGTALPLFDPTTDMPAPVVAALGDWLGRRTALRHRLALLHVRARQIVTASDTAHQRAAIADFTDLAAPLVRDMTPPDPQAPALPAPAPAAFSRDRARVALMALRDLDVPWYVISGTFLGAVREGDFLAHDYDIDIGVQAEDFDDAAFRAEIAATEDLVIVNASAHLDLSPAPDGRWTGTPRPALYRVLHANGTGIDVFVHHRDGDLRWHGSAKHRWDNSAFAQGDHAIAGLPVKGPADADRYLTENYGDWRTPVTTFNCSTGTPNVRFPRNPSALAEHLRLALAPRPTRDTQVARLILWQEGHLQRRGHDTVIAVFPQAAPHRHDRDCTAAAENVNEAPVPDTATVDKRSFP